MRNNRVAAVFVCAILQATYNELPVRFARFTNLGSLGGPKQMPIKFRCAYCNQLMGISRRKAGTVVRCPNCAGQVVVPATEQPPADPGPEPESGSREVEPLFERNDFEEVFNAASSRRAVSSAPPPPPPAPAAAAPSAPYKKREPARPYEVERLDFPENLPAPSEPPGIYLSPAMATLLSVAVVVALALAFTAGLVVGRFMYAPTTTEDKTEQISRADGS